MGGGGNTSSSTNYRLASTVAQSGPIGISTGANRRLESGLWYGASDRDNDGVVELSDNCPLVANAGQQNNVHPATFAGDHCEDPEPDGVMDFTDNCPDAANAGQENVVHPATTAGDACDDPDGDAFMDIRESFVGTDPDDRCADTTTANDERGAGFGEPLSPWPVDINDDRKAGLSDILAYIPVFGSAFPISPYNARFDLNADNKVGLADILMFIPFFNLTCTP